MVCPKCNTECIDGSTFCIKCGTNLKKIDLINSSNIQNTINNNTSFQHIIEPKQVQQVSATASESIINSNQSNINTVVLNYFMYILAIILKPYKSYKEEESKLTDSKNSLILTLIITIAITVINLIKTIFNSVRVATYNWTGGYKYEWQWSNFKNIKWIRVIGKNFLIYACIIFAIAVVFYIGSLIIKKQLNFMKSLAISASSVIPFVIGCMILSPLFGLIWSPLSIVFMVAGLSYSIIILSNLMNYELKLDGDVKIYFYLACFCVLAVASYYLSVNLFTSSSTIGLNNIWSMFN